MKLALVFDELTQFGGAEKLLLAMHELWPQAPVYSAFASEKWLETCSENNIELKASFLQRFPYKEKLNKVYAPFFLYNMAYQSFDFNEFDVIVSVSARFAHNIITKPHTKHICYMNSPGRMLWEPSDYFLDHSSKSVLLSPSLNLLRQSDFVAAQRVDKFIANSKTPQERIKKYYGRSSDVIYPFYEAFYTPDASEDLEETESQKYFLLVSRLVEWKRVDYVVRAFKKMPNMTLKIVGEGPFKKKLIKMAGGSKNIQFLNNVSDLQKEKLLAGCSALIHPQLEDFGIVPLEAMHYGKPVVAYGRGGVTETVINGVTGVFYYEQTAKALIEVLLNFGTYSFDSGVCKARAAKFSKKRFMNSIFDYVSNIV